ncbi:hypothetical protein GNF76_27120 [Pseudomonas sp. CCM 7893]|uniref:Uncharacterized protein n=1 Tax=Pseudomonas spelaei TaxID=1055469 RepID=A0A6I3WLE6_9PSED|nr:hypothetical protein [Pseudomonas spelaei]MUF08019.1 hypothetical protein [Pseudomonas spelaei]
MSNTASRSLSTAIFIVLACGLAALAVSAVLYLFNLPQDGYVFLAGMIAVLLAGLVSALRREGGARTEDAVSLIAGISFFVWVAWKTLNK